MRIICGEKTHTYESVVVNSIDFVKNVLEACANTEEITIASNTEQMWVIELCSKMLDNPDADYTLDKISLKLVYERLSAVYFLLDYSNLLFENIVKLLINCISHADWAESRVRYKVYDCLGGRKSYRWMQKLYPNDIYIMQDKYEGGEKGVDFKWMLSLKTAPSVMKSPCISWSG